MPDLTSGSTEIRLLEYLFDVRSDLAPTSAATVASRPVHSTFVPQRLRPRTTLLLFEGSLQCSAARQHNSTRSLETDIPQGPELCR